MSSSRSIQGLEKALGYTFRDRRLVQDALTHKSYYYENPKAGHTYNERLEFLGDTVLGLVIAEELYAITPPLAESEMAKIKSYLVSGRILSSLADTLGIGDHVLLGKGESETGGRQKGSILADSLEAIFGAIFIDRGFAAVRRIIRKMYTPVLMKALEEETYLDYKTEMQEICQNRYGVLPEYRVVAEEGLEHKKIFTVEVFMQGTFLGCGSGTSKKAAEINAAKDAYLRMDSSGD